MKRLVVVADNSLIIEAIAIGLRDSGEFRLVGHVNGAAPSAGTILDASPVGVLVDDREQSSSTVDLIRQLNAAQDAIVVIVLTMTMDSWWLDAIFDAGATSAISKATHPVALATLVRETINGHVIHPHKRASPVEGVHRHALTAADSCLTARELEVLRLVAGGSTNGEIARRLWVTEQTVKFHLSNVYRKLDVGNRTEASHYAHVNGLLGAKPQLVAS